MSRNRRWPLPVHPSTWDRDDAQHRAGPHPVTAAGRRRDGMQQCWRMHPEPQSNTITPPVRVSVRGPAALAAALQYLVDSPCDNRVVLAVVGMDNLLRYAAHTHLPTYPAGASPEVRHQWADDVGRLIQTGLAALAPSPDERAAVVLYLPAAFGGPTPEFARRIRSAVWPAPFGLLDVIAVFEGRWRSLACVDEACCPSAGSPILDDGAAVEVCAELVGAGLAVRTGPRAPLPTSQRSIIAHLLAGMPYPRTVGSRRSLLRRAWPLVAQPPLELAPQQVAALVMAADRPGVRDALLTRMARAAGAEASWWQTRAGLWRDVLHAAPADWASGPACMAAVSSWAIGDAAGATAAVEQALQSEPDHRMAALIGTLLAKGIPATDWFTRMSAIGEADCLRFDRPPSAARGGRASIAG